LEGSNVCPVRPKVRTECALFATLDVGTISVHVVEMERRPAKSFAADTSNELERELAALPEGQLAALVAKLATDVPEVGRRIRDFLVRGQPAAAKRVHARLRAALMHEADFGWQGAATLGAELDEVLDLVEQAVLPHDGAAAFALLCDFIKRDHDAMEQADDSNGEVSAPFHRACELLARAAAQVPGAEAREAWEDLIAKNDYGCRDTLSDLAATALPPVELDRLVAALRATMRAGGDRAFSAAVTLMGVARGKPDPDLYAEAAYRGAPRERHPAVALEVAAQYLAAGRATEAAQHLPGSAELCGGHAHDWHETNVALARAQGDTVRIREALWARFCFAPGAAALRDLLAVEPEPGRPARRQAALAFIRMDTRDFAGKLRLLVEAGELAEAAATAIAEHVKLNGDLYFDLVPLAETFTAEHPLAATTVYRALLDSILHRARPKVYSHGAAYWHRLETLAPRVTAWEPLLGHETYAARVRAGHARKHAFWREVERHDPAAWVRDREARRNLLSEMLGRAEIEDVAD
jgi:hypothetical protein